MKETNCNETKNRHKYLPDRKLFELYRKDKIYNRFDLHVELIIQRCKRIANLHIKILHI